eukprot:GHRR01024840.1.p1 GENE.GHRR01024840.1~~GHRR01024840.1.p1  ORF type:complete len:117 (-),score=34.43 GHRR01024840.1:2412-2762(-)
MPLQQPSSICIWGRNPLLASAVVHQRMHICRVAAGQLKGVLLHSNGVTVAGRPGKQLCTVPHCTASDASTALQVTLLLFGRYHLVGCCCMYCGCLLLPFLAAAVVSALSWPYVVQA